jgi:hypothetical protein
MKIWFLVIALTNCIVCPTDKPSIHFSLEDAAMEAARYKNAEHADLFEFDPKTRMVTKVDLPRVKIEQVVP